LENYSVVIKEVGFSAFRTNGEALRIEVEAMTIAADPSSVAGGIPHHESKWKNVFSNDCSGSNHGIFADAEAANNGGVGANAGSARDNGGKVLMLAGNGAAGVFYVGENAAGAEENVILAYQALVEGDIVLDLDAGADDDVGGDEDILADGAVVANDAVAHDMGEVPNGSVVANNGSGINNGGRMDCAGHAVLFIKEENCVFFVDVGEGVRPFTNGEGANVFVVEGYVYSYAKTG
jgi:hypothetical protein